MNERIEIDREAPNATEISRHIHTALTGHHTAEPIRQLAPATLTAPPKLLADKREGAAMIGVCQRQFDLMRPVLPAPVVLGVRCVRWRVADLQAWVEGLQSAAGARPEPAQLKRGKAARKGTPGSAPVAAVVTP